MIEIFYDVRCAKSNRLLMMLDKEGVDYTLYDMDSLEGSMEASYREILWDYTPVVYIDGVKQSTTEPIILYDDIMEKVSGA